MGTDLAVRSLGVASQLLDLRRIIASATEGGLGEGRPNSVTVADVAWPMAKPPEPDQQAKEYQ